MDRLIAIVTEPGLWLGLAMILCALALCYQADKKGGNDGNH